MLMRRQNDFFITGSEDGTVWMYSLETNSMDKMLTRSTLPIRDIALSPDGNWAAVASEWVQEAGKGRSKMMKLTGR